MDAALLLAPLPIQIQRWTAIGDLPHFNPDVEMSLPLPDSVIELRRIVENTDGIIISCPEYARGVPGSFKNALDWLVGCPADDKLIALWNASPRSRSAQDALRLILNTMLGEVIEATCLDIPLMGRGLSAAQIADDAELSQMIRTALQTLANQCIHRQGS